MLEVTAARAYKLSPPRRSHTPQVPKMLKKHKKQKTGRPSNAQSLGLPPGTWKTIFGAPTTVAAPVRGRPSKLKPTNEGAQLLVSRRALISPLLPGLCVLQVIMLTEPYSPLLPPRCRRRFIRSVSPRLWNSKSGHR